MFWANEMVLGMAQRLEKKSEDSRLAEYMGHNSRSGDSDKKVRP